MNIGDVVTQAEINPEASGLNYRTCFSTGLMNYI